VEQQQQITTLRDIMRQPETLEELGVPPSIVIDLMLRLLFTERRERNIGVTGGAPGFVVGTGGVGRVQNCEHGHSFRESNVDYASNRKDLTQSHRYFSDFGG